MNADRLLALYEKVAEAPDAIVRLRRFVLDLAVRGKLVAQHPADEPASELLRRIAAEKARLVKAGEIKNGKVPSISLADFPYSIPGNWTWTTLGTVGDWGAGSTPSRSNPDLYGGGMTWLKSGELGDRIALKGSEETVTEKAVQSGSFRRNKPGDVLIAMYGATIGKLAILAEEAVTNQAVCGCTPFSGVSNRFLFLFLLAQRVAFQASSEGGAQPNISKVKVVGTPFPLAPLAEQRRIVAKVEELMALLDRLEAARQQREATRDRLTAASLARLTAPDTDPTEFPVNARFALATLPALTTRPDQIKPLRQTILNLAVRGKLVEQDPADEPALDYLLGLDAVPSKTHKQLKPLDPSNCGGDLPASWVWLPLGAIIRAMDAGWSPQCENHPRSSVDEWGVLKTTAVQALAFDPMQHKLLPAKLKPRPEFLAKVGDILVTRAGPKNRVGVSCVVDVPCPKLMISDKLIRFHAVGDLSPRYIALTLNAGHTFDQLEAAKSGMAVMQMNISQGKLRAIPIPLPPLAEQHRIVAKVDALMALCDRLEASLTTADTARQRLLETLLHEALTPDKEREAAA